MPNAIHGVSTAQGDFLHMIGAEIGQDVFTSALFARQVARMPGQGYCLPQGSWQSVVPILPISCSRTFMTRGVSHTSVFGNGNGTSRASLLPQMLAYYH